MHCRQVTGLTVFCKMQCSLLPHPLDSLKLHMYMYTCTCTSAKSIPFYWAVICIPSTYSCYSKISYLTMYMYVGVLTREHNITCKWCLKLCMVWIVGSNYMYTCKLAGTTMYKSLSREMCWLWEEPLLVVLTFRTVYSVCPQENENEVTQTCPLDKIYIWRKQCLKLVSFWNTTFFIN